MLNKIYQEDVMDVLRRQESNSVDCIYADPDYNVGVKYHGTSHKKPWKTYHTWYAELITESMRVLKPTGNLFTINYPRQNAHLRVKCLEKLAYDIQEYVWIYNTNIGHSKRRFTTAHRSILHATKSKHNAFYKEQVALPYQNPTDKRIQQRMVEGSRGRMPYSWFYFDLVKNVSKDKKAHPCQIPLKLTEMLFNASTIEGDTIFILFSGSGNECTLVRDMGRKFISCDVDEDFCALYTTSQGG